MAVLERIMIRSSKAGVTESRLLPPCTKAVVRLPFDPQHQVLHTFLPLFFNSFLTNLKAEASARDRGRASATPQSFLASVLISVGLNM